jgi:hypothetical protein
VITISSAREIRVEALPEWLRGETKSVLQPLNEKCNEILDKVRERVDDFSENCDRLELEGGREAERGRAKRKAKVTLKLVKFFKKQIRQIVFPDQTAFTEMRKFRETLEGAFNLILRERNTWFPRISPLFIIARRRVDLALSKLANSVSEFHDFLENDFSKAKDVEDLLVRSEELLRYLESQRRLEKREKSVNSRISAMEKKLGEYEQKITLMAEASEVQTQGVIEEKLWELRTRMKHEFRHLQKPLKKLSNLTRDSSRYMTSGGKEKLWEYLQDPYQALATEEKGYPVLKAILQGLKQSIEEGRLKLKSSRLRKALEKIEAILERGDLDSLYVQSAAILSKSEEIKTSKEMQKAQTHFKQLQKGAEDHRKRIKANRVKLDPIRKRRTRIQEKIDEIQHGIQEMTLAILQKKITVIT